MSSTGIFVAIARNTWVKIIIFLYYGMLESDWMMNVLRFAIIFRETKGECSSRQLLVTSQNDLCYFKGLTTAK